MTNHTVFSIELESTTDRVIEYIHHLENDNYNITRINGEEWYDNLKILLSSEKIELCIENKNKQIPLSGKTAWYRRGDLNIRRFWEKELVSNSKLIRYINEELKQINYFIHDYATKLGGLNKEFGNNKLINLFKAKDYGLRIPNTLITTKRNDLLLFLKENKKIITKPLHHGHIYYNIPNTTKAAKSPGTIIFPHCKALELKEYFAPSLFQEYIEKELEVRVFFLDGKLYSMAIFSQLDEQTSIDFRNYNIENPNRAIPFRFPSSIERKIIRYISSLGYLTCSADFILSKDGNFYFLEINPTGQFGWVSKNCNYYLEKKIAEFLIAN